MQIFISYAKQDSLTAEKIYDDLNSIDELQPWLDKHNLLPGMEWEEEIYDAIEKSRFIIIIFSNNSVDKMGFVQKEIRKAIDVAAYYPPGKGPLIPIRINECEIYRGLEKYQWYDMFSDWNEGMIKIRQRIKGELKEKLSNIFTGFKPFLYTTDKIQEWIKINGKYLQKFRAKTVIEFLNKKYDTYKSELEVLDVMIWISYQARTDSFIEYVFRSYDIAKKLKYAHELPDSYGIVIGAANLLPDYVKTVFFRDMYENNIKYLSPKMLDTSAIYDTSWADQLLLRDITKHFLSQKVGRYETDSEVFLKAIDLITWDIVYIDLVIFFARISGEYSMLRNVIPLLKGGFRKGELDIKLPEITPDEHYRKYLVFYKKEMHYADKRENCIRLGLLLRIGEYLTYDKEEKNRKIGLELREKAIAKLKFENRVELKDKKESIALFKTAETLSGATMVPMKVFCEKRDLTTGEYNPVKLDQNILFDVDK